MRVAIVTAAAVALAVLLGAARPTAISTPTPAAASHAGSDTRCGLCHTAGGWATVTFPHDQTGFPLRGSHARVSCKACHAAGFEAPLPDVCAACHRDPHAGDFGLRCASCHDEESWRTTFGADAHRRTNFPLQGRHALVPCQECHPDAASRSFRSPALPCISCHLRDWQRTALTTIDHGASGFSTDCRTCHDAWRFERGRLPSHDRCFQISSGEHAGIRCLDCHSALRGAAITGGCNTGTAACTACHEHSCGRTDGEHRGVAGYQCKDRKCYECHRFSEGARAFRALGGRRR